MDTIEIIKELCYQRRITLAELERSLNYGNGSLSKSQTIKSDRLVKIADYFGVTVDFLLGRDSEYYNDPEVASMTQTLKARPEMKVLFDASSKVSKEDIELVVQMLERMKK